MMKLIDEKLGGTTPLEVILKFPKKEKVKSDDDDEFDDWGDEDQSDENIGLQKIKLIKFHLSCESIILRFILASLSLIEI